MTHEQVYATVSAILVSYLRLKPTEVTLDSHIVNDLGADSLALVELGFKFAEAFKIPMIDPTDENLVLSGLVNEIHQELSR